MDRARTAESMPPDVSAELLGVVRQGVRLMALHALGELDDADEVAQETLARVLVAAREGRVRELATLGAYARGVARHVIVDMLRARRRELPLAGPALDTPAASDSPLELLVHAEQLYGVHRAFDCLSQADREILRLTYVECAKSEDVARSLKVPAPRVRKRKERALERLRRAFDGGNGHASMRPATVVHAALSARVLRTE